MFGRLILLFIDVLIIAGIKRSPPAFQKTLGIGLLAFLIICVVWALVKNYL